MQSVYIGGGTPTFMNATQIEQCLNVLKIRFDIDPQAEWTMEANPEGLDRDQLKVMREMGVNRISLGMQSLNEKYLKYLGRVHDKSSALHAFEKIRDAGFHNINVDLMFSFAQQTMDEFKKDVKSIVALQSDHISAYNLTVEENSRFYAKKIGLPTNDFQREQYVTMLSMLKDAGYDQYEVSNFARSGRQSSHNLNYWLGGNYIGLGLGAHSHVNGRRFWNIGKLLEYIKCVEDGQSVIEGEETLCAHDRFMEAFIFSLRMNAGVCLKSLEEKFGETLDEQRRMVIDECLRNELLMLDQGKIKAQLKGRLVLDEIASRLI